MSCRQVKRIHLGVATVSECRTFLLTDFERDRLAAVLDEIPYDPHGGTSYLVSIRIAAATAMPRRIVDALNEQRASLHPRPYLVFDNLPTDDQVFTVPVGDTFDPSVKTGVRSENLAIAFASLIGEPYSISFEGGTIVNNLIPFSKGDYTGLGSDVELGFHIENAALRFIGDDDLCPLGVLLTGVRRDPSGPLTRVSDAREALRALPPSDIECLRQPLYRIRVPYRWRGAPAACDFQQTRWVPLVSGNVDLPEVSAVFYPDMVEAQSDRAALALDGFHKAIRDVSVGVDVVPGRVVYVDNRFALHSRDSFAATLGDDGLPLRWIQRVFVAPNLWGYRRFRQVKTRVFQPAEMR